MDEPNRPRVVVSKCVWLDVMQQLSRDTPEPRSAKRSCLRYSFLSTANLRRKLRSWHRSVTW